MMGHVFQDAGSRGVAEGVTVLAGVPEGISFGVNVGDGEATLVGERLNGVSMDAEADCVAHAVSPRLNTKCKKRFISTVYAQKVK
jgi:hypothetical protein